MSSSQKVLVGLSGGVDSAVAALLLKQQGYEVVGVTLSLLTYTKEDGEGCCTFNDVLDATKVCDVLGIEHLVISRRKQFKELVIDPFLEGHKHGVFHNPCVTCNTTVKLPTLVQIADHMGIPYVATGHYARTDKATGLLCKALDASKDQTYFLWELSTDLIKRCLFPLGDLHKTEVRAMAEAAGLVSVSQKKDSTNLCFLEGGTKQEFLEKNGIHPAKGQVLDKDNNVLGTHNGYSSYVTGQRAPVTSKDGKPRYVLKVLADTNTLVVGSKEETTARTVRVNNTRWVGQPWLNTPVMVSTRYSHDPASAVEAVITEEETGWVVTATTSTFQSPTTGQSLVVYKDNLLVGGGKISDR